MTALNSSEQWMLIGVLVVAFISLLYAYWLWRDTVRRDKGSEAMQVVWQAIKTGANAYLRRQLRTILPILVLLAVALFFSVYVVKPSAQALELFNGDVQAARLGIGFGRMLAFIAGASFSMMVGQLGMRVAIEGNIRVAAEAVRENYNGALTVAYRAGTFTGMLTDGLGLLGGTIIFMIFGKAAPDALLGFGFGGTLVALFMRIGGGIYTKAADVGADLVGKVEQGLPEDDPRNAAVVADLVGDNVGDCAGMAADIFESYEVTIVSTLILGLFLYGMTGMTQWIVYPLIVRGDRCHLFYPGYLYRSHLGKVPAQVLASQRCRGGDVPFVRGLLDQHRRLGFCLFPALCRRVAVGHSERRRRRIGGGL